MHPRPIRVLLIEDEPAQAWLVRSFLLAATDPRFEMDNVESLAEGIARLGHGGIDVVLLDLSLPDSVGPETFFRIKQEHPNLPVVALTGLEDDAVGLRLVQAGAQDYLVKNQVSSPLLCRAIRYAVERARAAQEQHRLIQELQQAIAEVDTLSGLLPICSACKKVRNDKGYWSQIETYITQHSRAQFTHGLCPECVRKYFPRPLSQHSPSHPLPNLALLLNQGREAGDQISILIVEDEPGDAYLAINAIKTARISNAIHVVEDGKQALAFLRREGQYEEAPRPGLILLDSNLPGKSGRDVLAEIREDPKLASIPVIMISGSKAEEDALRGSALKAICFLRKPIDPSQFYAVIPSIQNFWLSVVQPRAGEQTPS